MIPVSAATNGGTGMPGLVSVANSPRVWPARTLTAPNSVMPASTGAPPVVSRSTTTKVTSDNGVPRSAKEDCTAWPPAGRSVGGDDGTVRPYGT